MKKIIFLVMVVIIPHTFIHGGEKALKSENVLPEVPLTWNQMPPMVRSFRQALLKAKKPGDLERYFKFPVVAYEVAYTEEREGYSYAYHYRTEAVNNIGDLFGYMLEPLKEAWDSEELDKEGGEVFVVSKKVIQPCNLEWFGVSFDEELQHNALVGIKENKIQAVMLDADPGEVTSLKGFKTWNLGECR